MQDMYCLPDDYRCNPAATFDADEAHYWDPARVEASLAYQADFYAWVLSVVVENNFQSLADFGCGTAAKLARLHAGAPDLNTCGLDQPNAIAMCQQHYPFGEWIACDLDRPESMPERKFDLIMASDVIEHLDNPDNLLNSMRQVAHEHSLIMLSTPDRDSLRGASARIPGNPYHVREWTQAEFASYLASRNLEVITHRLLPAFRPTHSMAFARRALKRWARLKGIRYNQGVLARFRAER